MGEPLTRPVRRGHKAGYSVGKVRVGPVRRKALQNLDTCRGSIHAFGFVAFVALGLQFAHDLRGVLIGVAAHCAVWCWSRSHRAAGRSVQ